MDKIEKRIERESCIKLYALLIQAKRMADRLGSVNPESKNYLNYRSNIAQIIDGIQDDFMHCDLSEEDLLAMAKENAAEVLSKKAIAASTHSSLSPYEDEDDEDDDNPF